MKPAVLDCFTHVYKRGTTPFRSLSALADADAMDIMHLFHQIIEQSQKWSVLPHEFKSIDQSGYAAFLENASQLFLGEFQITT